jgi:SAM-dependent methyltransferase
VSIERKDCRLCGGDLYRVFSLKPSPIANSYPDKPDRDALRYPMDLMQCSDCGHVQQRYVFHDLFVDYKYQTPQAVATYLEPLAKQIADRHGDGKLLEIGCNNGVFLDLVKSLGMSAMGVDPATTHPLGLREYFTEELAKRLGKFDVICGFNVFAHIDDLDDVFRGISSCLEPDGEVIFEVQYLPDLLQAGAFDLIYHEHTDYHHLAPLARFLKKHGLVMVHFDHIYTHGGSIRVTAQKIGFECEIPQERIDWAEFDRKLTIIRQNLHARLPGKVQAFGAAAKATTLISQLGLEDRIECVVDDTPQKQHRYIPGTDIPILPVSALHDGPVLMTAWNYEAEIRERISNPLIHPFR